MSSAACAYETPRSLISRTASSLNSRVNCLLSMTHLPLHKTPNLVSSEPGAAQGSGLPPPELEDAQIAEATSSAAMKMVLAREERSALKKDDRISDFVTDAYATVGIAYHRAAGVYTTDKEMQELGTAAVHLLTMATSYMRAQ